MIKNPFKPKPQDDDARRIAEAERRIQAILLEYNCHIEPVVALTPRGMAWSINIAPNEEPKQ